jgi:hypothetical protein
MELMVLYRRVREAAALAKWGVQDVPGEPDWSLWHGEWPGGAFVIAVHTEGGTLVPREGTAVFRSEGLVLRLPSEVLKDAAETARASLVGPGEIQGG